MRFASIGRLSLMTAFVAALSAGTAQADVSTPSSQTKHKLHLPQSFVSLLSTIEKPFAVSPPLAAPVAKSPSTTKEAVLETVTPTTSVASATQTVLHPLDRAEGRRVQLHRHDAPAARCYP